MLKVGIVGSGFGLYGLLPAFHSIRECNVVAICGNKTDRLLNYCKSIDLKKVYTNWEEMLSSEKLDAIALAVPPYIQYEIARVAIKKGLNVFAEKPLAVTSKQARELLRLVKVSKVNHTVDFIFPEIEEWQKVKTLIDKRTYGKLLSLKVSWNFLSYDIANKKVGWKTEVSKGGGALSFYFSHSLHYLEYFAGKISRLKSSLIYSKKKINDGEVGVDLDIRFKTGIKGFVHLNCESKRSIKHELIFECEKGILTLKNMSKSLTNFEIKVSTPTKNTTLPLPQVKINRGEDERVRLVRKIAKRFVKDCLNNENSRPSFEEGFRVQKLIENIRKQQSLSVN